MTKKTKRQRNLTVANWVSQTTHVVGSKYNSCKFRVL